MSSRLRAILLSLAVVVPPVAAGCASEDVGTSAVGASGGAGGSAGAAGGAGGVGSCGAGGGVGGGASGPACMARSCAERGFECGQHDDGCGEVIECGACTEPERCGESQVNGRCGPCASDADCDDGLSCTAPATCVEGLCIPGPVDPCDDHVACTVDYCDPAWDVCLNTPSYDYCGIDCGGRWTCSPTEGCLPPTGPLCPEIAQCVSTGEYIACYFDCAVGNGGCSPDAVCDGEGRDGLNLRCTCRPGFCGDGYTCTPAG